MKKATMIGACLVLSLVLARAQGEATGAYQARSSTPTTEITTTPSLVKPAAPESLASKWLRTENPQYSGVLVKVARTDNPLQLINPAAPARYGNGIDNVVVDPISRRTTGLAFFSFKW